LRAGNVTMGFQEKRSEATKTTGPNPSFRKVLLTTKDILGLVIITQTHFGLRSAARLYY